MEIVRYLVESKSADVNAPPSRCDGFTTMQIVGFTGDLQLATFLLEHGADINAPPCELDVCGDVPEVAKNALDLAAERGRHDLVQFFLNAGAVSQRRVASGYDGAIALAEEEHHFAIADLIRKHAADNQAPGLIELQFVHPFRDFTEYDFGSDTYPTSDDSETDDRPEPIPSQTSEFDQGDLDDHGEEDDSDDQDEGDDSDDSSSDDSSSDDSNDQDEEEDEHVGGTADDTESAFVTSLGELLWDISLRAGGIFTSDRLDISDVWKWTESVGDGNGFIVEDPMLDDSILEDPKLTVVEQLQIWQGGHGLMEGIPMQLEQDGGADDSGILEEPGLDVWMPWPQIEPYIDG